MNNFVVRIPFLALAVAIDSAAQQPLPRPTGPYRTGTTTYEWTDSTRRDTVQRVVRDTASGKLALTAPSATRSVVVQFWYPTDVLQGDTAEYNSEVAAFAGVITDTARLNAIRRTKSWSVREAPVRRQRHPVVLLSTGSGNFRSDYTSVAEDLASHGYVVGAISHPGISLLVFSDGHLGTEWRGWQPPPGLSQSLALDSLRGTTEFFASTRDAYGAHDVRFVLNELSRLNSSGASRFRGRLDLGKVAAIGHSTGGAVVTGAALADKRIRALVIYDVFLPRLLLGERLRVPLLLFRTDDTRYPPGWHERQEETFTLGAARGVDIVLKGGGHNSFNDRPLLTPERFPYKLAPASASAAVREYTLRFLSKALGGPGATFKSATRPELAEVKAHGFSWK